jgi:hypothetical protein
MNRMSRSGTTSQSTPPRRVATRPAVLAVEEILGEDAKAHLPRFDPNFALILLVVLVLGSLIVVVLGPALARRMGPPSREADPEMARRLDEAEKRIDQEFVTRTVATSQVLQGQFLEARLRLNAQEEKLSELKVQLADQEKAEGQKLRQQLAELQTRLVQEKSDFQRKVAELELRRADLESRVSYLQQTVTGLEQQAKAQTPPPKATSSSPATNKASPRPAFIVITGRDSR